MSEEILINVTPRETRIALVKNGMLQEVYSERASKLGLVGNIYKGRISRVLPGMQAAFVDIGLERAAFLHASDIHSIAGIKQEMDRYREEKKDNEGISSMCCEGQNILVQVVKDPLGSKGARLTTHLSIPSRYLVFMPGMDYIGVSQRIAEEQERSRLRDIVKQANEGGTGGHILRTVSEGVDEAAIRVDIEYLSRVWDSIQERCKTDKAPTVIYEDLPLVLRSMRDLVATKLEKVHIDSFETYEKVCRFVHTFIPDMDGRIEYYQGERPLFDLYGVEDEIQKALSRKVQLKSGGHVVIDQTEAMTTIDVNTGAFVGHRNLEETIFKTNLEASHAIARQLRLRNLGGIIIIDFIDMAEQEHKRQVLRTLERELDKDHAKSHICEVSPLGLVEMTRKRTRESLEHVLCEACPTCEGRGFIKTAETACYELFREIMREARQFEADQFLVMASQEVVDLLLDEESTSLAELEAFIGKPIKFQVEALYTQEQFDIVLL